MYITCFLLLLVMMPLYADIDDAYDGVVVDGAGDLFTVPDGAAGRGSAFLIDESSFFMPLYSVEQVMLVTNEELFFLPGGSGLLAEKGISSFLYIDGYISIHELFAFYYQFRQEASLDTVDMSVYRAFGRLRLGKWAFDFGRRGASFGPGKHGMLLSDSVRPFLQVRLQTVESLDFLGSWDLLFLKGWFTEERVDVDDPELLAMRVEYSPFSWLTLGAGRTTQYGGAGRPTYYPWEYPRIISAAKENYQEDVYATNRYDNDAYASWDVTFTIPMTWLWRDITFFTIYLQQAGTDVHLIWQRDNHKFMSPTLPFFFMKLYDCAYTGGIYTEIGRHSFRLEYVSTPYAFFMHHKYYHEGYSHDDIPIGHPFGRDVQSISFTHGFAPRYDISAGYVLSYVQAPTKQKKNHESSIADFWPLFRRRNNMQREWRISMMLEKNWGRTTLSGYLRYRFVYHTDKDPRPFHFDITDENRHRITAGMSFSFLL